jgi:hypothetical protein
MARCSHTYADSSQCRRIVSAEQRYCYSHDPARAAERRRNAARGGKAKASGELVGIKQRLSVLADDVLEEKVDKGVGAVASQILNVYLRAVSTELAVREQMELVERLETLEEALERQKGDRLYGA